MPTHASVKTAVHVVFVSDGEVLLLRRMNTGYEDGRWSVPAGHLDGGETVRAAALREAREEVDVGLALDDLTFGHVMHRRKADDEERIDFFVRAHRWEGDIRNAEPEKCEALAWVDPNRLPPDVIPYVSAGIAHVLEGTTYSEFGW